MNKASLLASIESKVLKIVKTTEQPDLEKNEAGIKSYVTNVLEQRGNSVYGRNIGWYTVDEGTQNEQAYLRDEVVSKNVVQDVLVEYMKTLSPVPFIRFKIDEVNEETRSAKVSVFKDNGDKTATEMTILVFKNGSSPINYVELT